MCVSIVLVITRLHMHLCVCGIVHVLYSYGFHDLTTEKSFKAHMTGDFMSAFLQHVGLLKVFYCR